MPSTTQSTLFDTLTPIQVQVLQSLVAGFSVTAAAQEAGIHRTAVHLWTRTLPDFARAYLTLRQQRADRLVDELGDLAINTFRQLLSDESAWRSSKSSKLNAPPHYLPHWQKKCPPTSALPRSLPTADGSWPETHPSRAQRRLPLRQSPQIQALLRQPCPPSPGRLKTNTEKRTRRSRSKQCLWALRFVGFLSPENGMAHPPGQA